jgi:quercetin dioxygenase-like cupin family protein
MPRPHRLPGPRWSTPLHANAQPTQAGNKQIFNATGVLLQFLVSPDEIGDEICLIRGTMPPGVVVPLHSQAEPEIVYILDGSLDAFKSNEQAGWSVHGVGDVITIPGAVKHALRNSSSTPAISALATKSELYRFFRELAQPFDPNRRPAAPTPEAMQELFVVAAEARILAGHQRRM